MTFLLTNISEEILEAEVSKLVMRVVCRYDQDERETDGAVHWNSMGPKLRKAFQKAGGRKFSGSDWLQYIMKEVTRRGSSIA